MMPQTTGVVISKEKLIALANARKYHARKRSLADISTRKALHLGLSHLKTHNEAVKSTCELELNCLSLKGGPIPPMHGVKSQPNSVERAVNSLKETEGVERKTMRSTSTSALPIAVLNLVPTQTIKLPKIHREVKERRETQPIPLGHLGPEETKEGPFTVVSFASRPLVFLEDHSKRPIPPLPRGRLKRLLSIPTADLQDNSLLGVFPYRRVGANLL